MPSTSTSSLFLVLLYTLLVVAIQARVLDRATPVDNNDYDSTLEDDPSGAEPVGAGAQTSWGIIGQWVIRIVLGVPCTYMIAMALYLLIKGSKRQVVDGFHKHAQPIAQAAQAHYSSAKLQLYSNQYFIQAGTYISSMWRARFTGKYSRFHRFEIAVGGKRFKGIWLLLLLVLFVLSCFLKGSGEGAGLQAPEMTPEDNSHWGFRARVSSKTKKPAPHSPVKKRGAADAKSRVVNELATLNALEHTYERAVRERFEAELGEERETGIDEKNLQDGLSGHARANPFATAQSTKSSHRDRIKDLKKAVGEVTSKQRKEDNRIDMEARVKEYLQEQAEEAKNQKNRNKVPLIELNIK